MSDVDTAIREIRAFKNASTRFALRGELQKRKRIERLGLGAVPVIASVCNGAAVVTFCALGHSASLVRILDKLASYTVYGFEFGIDAS